MDNTWCGLPKPMAIRKGKLCSIVRVLGIRKDEDWRKHIRLVFPYMPHEMKYSCGTTQ